VKESQHACFNGDKQMHRRFSIFALSAVVAATPLCAGQSAAPAPTHVKSAEQIRCELFQDTREGKAACGATRGWITSTGETVTRIDKIQAQVAHLGQRMAVRKQVERRTRKSPADSRSADPAIEYVPSSNLYINFGMNSSEITDDAFAQANALYEAVRGVGVGWKQYRFEVAGHGDAVGSAAYNQELSRRRAQALANLLVTKGVDRSQLSIIGYGFSRPIEGLQPTDGMNRRVEIKRLN
jgi:outer membrane protein OmpA-like peptidoglycan-associated protein